MEIPKKVEAFFAGNQLLVKDGLDFNTTLENIKLMAKACEELQPIISQYEGGSLSQEQFIAKSISSIAREFIQLRSYKDSVDLQW
ncbi:hypothetical protein [Klebsiella pneumoniae]|jgi:hypothetical protein|uniref:hypothetical protein n=1 Tax=Klebsiella pneumoniae TaxID=573 RepID=UPI0022E01198|nr:hypothetical protein [Klebsiella pneumoniae]